MTREEKLILELEHELNIYKKVIQVAGFDVYNIDLDCHDEMKKHHVLSSIIGDDITVSTKPSACSDDSSETHINLVKLLNEDVDKIIYEFKTKNEHDEELWFKDHATTVNHPITNKRHMIGLIENVTHEKESYDQLIYRANHDELTGVYNRHGGFDILKQKLTSLDPEKDNVIIAYLDIDNLKMVNDEFGHLMGDKVIKRLPEVFEGALTDEDLILRVGVDEFILVAFNQDVSKLRETLELAHQNYVNSFDPAYNFGFSYGVVKLDKFSEDKLDEIIHASDLYMHLNKIERKLEGDFLHKPVSKKVTFL